MYKLDKLTIANEFKQGGKIYNILADAGRKGLLIKVGSNLRLCMLKDKAWLTGIIKDANELNFQMWDYSCLTQMINLIRDIATEVVQPLDIMSLNDMKTLKDIISFDVNNECDSYFIQRICAFLRTGDIFNASSAYAVFLIHETNNLGDLYSMEDSCESIDQICDTLAHNIELTATYQQYAKSCLAKLGVAVNVAKQLKLVEKV